MLRIRRSVRVVLLLPTLAGVSCATLTRGEHQILEITSEPTGAEIEILPLRREMTTPARLEVRKDRVLTIFVRKPGYVTKRAFVDRDGDPEALFAYAGNLLFGGIIGIRTDLESGALFRLVPNPVHVVLEPEPAEEANEDPGQR